MESPDLMSALVIGLGTLAGYLPGYTHFKRWAVLISLTLLGTTALLGLTQPTFFGQEKGTIVLTTLILCPLAGLVIGGLFRAQLGSVPKKNKKRR